MFSGADHRAYALFLSATNRYGPCHPCRGGGSVETFSPDLVTRSHMLQEGWSALLAFAGTNQVTQRLLIGIRHSHRHQLAGSVAAGEFLRIAAVCLDSVAGLGGYQTLARLPHRPLRAG